MKIRKVRISDSKDITNIYEYYIQHSTATFEETPVAESEMEIRIGHICKNYPYWVVEDDNIVIGYAYINSWKPRSAYKWSAEVSIYLSPNHLGKGIGKVLFEKLLEETKKTDIKTLLAGISLPNQSSIGLHEKYGFKKVAHFKNIGYKFKQWIDVGYWQLEL